MIKSTFQPDHLLRIRRQIKADQPLIHCITNHISINDCANIVLAAGAKPIMAEHPAEMAEITSLAGALAVNLGNINDTRMSAMLIAGQTAAEHHVPTIIDVVGTACSTLRLTFANSFITSCHPAVIKGNLSELKALAGAANDAKGIDAGKGDSIDAKSMPVTVAMLRKLACRTGAVIVATGATDLITTEQDTFLIANGTPMLPLVTGTGCMLNVLTAAYLASCDILHSTILATATLGICGELAAINAAGPASFHTMLLDNIYSLSDDTFSHRLHCHQTDY